MSEPPNQIPEELHVLAGEYVLGALDAAEMRAVRRQAMVDPALAAAISGWERRLAPMTQAVPAVPPPEALWARIEQTIAPLADETAEPTARPRLATVMPPSASPAGPPRPELARPPTARPGRVWPWQLATAASLALAAGVAGVVLLPSLALRLHVPMLGVRSAPEVAVLMPAVSHGDARQDGPAAQMAADTNTPRTLSDGRPDAAGSPPPAESRAPAFLAEARPDGTVVLTALAQVEVPAGKSLELWILPPGAKAPKSLGVLPAGGHRVAMPAMPPAGSALLVSLEPPGGSPTGAPTGPVVYTGKLGQVPL